MEQLVAATNREQSSKNEESSVKRDGAREEWSEGAICTLIDAYTAKYGELNGKGLRSKDWAEVVAAVNSNQKSTKTVEHCRNKMDTLTKRFKAERKNKLSGVESCWPWYHKMEIIRGCSPAKGVPVGIKLPIGGPEKDRTALNRPKTNKRAKKTYTLEDLSAVASDQFEEKNKFPVESGHVLVDSNGKDRDPAGLDSIAVAAPNSDDQPLARSIADLAGSLQRIAGNLRSGITEFAEMYARVEISKMEIFRDLELKRIQMQLDSQVKLAAILNKRKRDDSESE